MIGGKDDPRMKSVQGTNSSQKRVIKSKKRTHILASEASVKTYSDDVIDGCVHRPHYDS